MKAWQSGASKESILWWGILLEILLEILLTSKLNSIYKFILRLSILQIWVFLSGKAAKRLYIVSLFVNIYIHFCLGKREEKVLYNIKIMAILYFVFIDMYNKVGALRKITSPRKKNQFLDTSLIQTVTKRLCNICSV